MLPREDDHASRRIVHPLRQRAPEIPCERRAASRLLAGQRAKTGKRDAVFLARMLAVGNVVKIAAPTPAMEAARDLARAREGCRRDLMRQRHPLSKFLLRKGVAHGSGKRACPTASRSAHPRNVRPAKPGTQLDGSFVAGGLIGASAARANMASARLKSVSRQHMGIMRGGMAP